MIAEALDGRRLLVTGATGFLGTALVERLLRAAPGCEVVVLIRAGRRSSVEQRVQRELLRNDAFDRLRSELGREGFEAMAARRLRVVRGDVTTDGLGLDDDGRDLVATCDIAIHSAASVAFDSPLDTAVEVNLLGPLRVAATMGELNPAAHLVAVSTCYVAGNRRGEAPEALLPTQLFALDLDWRAEVAAARRLRADLDAESRSPEMLRRFREEARRELGAAGIPLLAEKTEQRRTRWVDSRLVDAGRSRAASLGWPDAYAYTKALGEAALAETKGELRTTIVRPSIIESALSEPKPGWIRGFRMAEPVILSYARGLLKQFPGVPEGVVDVIPVDLVVGALCAVAALPPPAPTELPVVQVASGSANPLRYRRIVDLIRDWFGRHPLYDRNGQPIVPPEFAFPNRGKVQGQLERARSVLERAERVLAALPLRGEQAEWSARLEERREEVDRALSYVQLYGAYAESEAIFRVDRLLSLVEQVDAADLELFGFDPRVIDWDRYVHEVHLPSIVVHARVRTTAGRRTGPSREDRLRAGVLAPERHLAVFDLENTLIASNVVESYAWLATRRLEASDRWRFVARTLREAPSMLALDRKDRGDFLRSFYRRYEGAPVDQLEHDAAELFRRLILAKSFPAGIRRVREHRRAGHRTLLITGALDVVVASLQPLFDDIVAASLDTTWTDGRRTYKGEMLTSPPTGEARAQIMHDYCLAHGLSLEETVAYADSASDLPMLEAAGFPVAVNPETRLAAIARSRGWLVEDFARAPGTSRLKLPLAPPARSAGATT